MPSSLSFFVSSFFFYELVIPIFEQATMTDQAFAFIDEFVFYFPAGLCLAGLHEAIHPVAVVDVERAEIQNAHAIASFTPFYRIFPADARPNAIFCRRSAAKYIADLR